MSVYLTSLTVFESFIINYFDSGDAEIKTSAFTNKKKATINKSEKEKREPKGICCAACRSPITRAEYAIEVEGRHQHSLTNPSGMTFKIGLFQQANAKAETEAVSEFSWFAGYQWRIVSCPSCSQHLGWSYHRDHSPDFYGLILNKLIDFDK